MKIASSIPVASRSPGIALQGNWEVMKGRELSLVLNQCSERSSLGTVIRPTAENDVLVPTAHAVIC